jgi:holo-[acyl-carrier protein] synthase
MPTQVGIDVVTRSEVEDAVRHHGERYLTRVYTERELRDTDRDPLRLAARFAAKEAAMKALGRGEEPLPWRDIAVHRDASGRPTLELTGRAGRLADDTGVRSLSVSLTHEGDIAAAVVLAELRTEP